MYRLSGVWQSISGCRREKQKKLAERHAVKETVIILKRQGKSG